jgi:hypothetical protein
MKSLVSVVTVGVALGVLACGPPATVAFDGYGYKHQGYGYRVLNQGGDRLLPPEWALDNLYWTSSKKLEQKHTPDYLATFKFDIDGDGDTDRDEKGFLYDLRFKHTKRDAVIWLRTLPISTDLREKDLRVLVQRYVDEVSGAGFEAVQLGPDSIVIREKRYAANVVSRGAFTIAKQEAFETTFDVANVDEIAINPNARQTRVRVALIRTPFKYPKRQRDKFEFPVLMLVGYANLPEDFSKDEPAFNGVLARIQIGADVGVTPRQLEQLAPAATPSAPASAAAPAPAAPAPSVAAPTPSAVAPVASATPVAGSSGAPVPANAP